MASRTSYRPAVTAIAGLFILLVALPSQWKTWAPSFLKPDFHFGLDLAGGTQLDFRISEDEIKTQLAELNAQIAAAEANGGSGASLTDLQNQRAAVVSQQQNLVEAIRTVLERRINSLGVSEAVITPSFVGDEKHLLIDCPGVVDVQKCIETVGKTIQLEFKEEFAEAPAGYEAGVRAKADDVQRRITAGATLATVGQDLGDDLGLAYEESNMYFRDQLPKGLENLWDSPAGPTVYRREGSISVPQQNAQGQVVNQDIPGVFLVQVLKAKTGTGRVINEASKAFEILAKTESGATYRYENEVAMDASQPTRIVSTIRGMEQGDLKATSMDDGSARLVFLRQVIAGKEQVDVSHILVSYKGADDAAAAVTRTKAEALARAQDLKKQLDGGANFETLASAQSDGPSAKNQGKLGLISRGDIVPAFENVAFSNPTGFVSQPVETNFGYHIIKVNKAAETTPDKASFDSLNIVGSDALGRANDMIDRMQEGKVTQQQDAVTLRSLFFSLKPTGWKDTELDGKHFRTANVTLDPTTNLPVVQIVFDAEGGRIFQQLTKNNVGKQIAIFVGGELVSAPTVQGEIAGGTAVITGSSNITEAQKLAQDLNTGAIPAPIHLSGQRTVEATLGAEALRTSVLAALVGAIIVMLYMILVYRLLGVIASIALVVYSLIFLVLLKYPLFFFSSQYIVLTLAGAAGLILSIGMAVDTNVLVFERVKEEMKRGKSLKTAVEIGFEKAWPSIRDSNISTIITCALLFLIGTSIVRGFAITLGLGVLISMFSGMIVSKWIARKIANTKLADKPALFPKAGDSQVAVG